MLLLLNKQNNSEIPGVCYFEILLNSYTFFYIWKAHTSDSGQIQRSESARYSVYYDRMVFPDVLVMVFYYSFLYFALNRFHCLTLKSFSLSHLFFTSKLDFRHVLSAIKYIFRRMGILCVKFCAYLTVIWLFLNRGIIRKLPCM